MRKSLTLLLLLTVHLCVRTNEGTTEVALDDRNENGKKYIKRQKNKKQRCRCCSWNSCCPELSNLLLNVLLRLTFSYKLHIPVSTTFSELSYLFIYLFLKKKLLIWNKKKWSLLWLSSWSLPRSCIPTMPSSTAWAGSSATSAGCSNQSRTCFKDSVEDRLQVRQATVSGSAAAPTLLKPPDATN